MANPQPYQSQPPQQAPVQNQTFFLPGQQPTSTYQEPQPAQTQAQPVQHARNTSTDSRASLREHERMHSSYKDWLAPAAVGAGAGAAGTAAYNHHQNSQAEPDAEVQQHQPPTEPGVAGDRSLDDPMPAAPSTSEPTNGTAPNTYLSYPSSAGPDAGLAGSSAAPAPLNGHVASSELGGQEARGAHETGRIFPSVVRHDTDMSIGQLHVPGSYS